MDTDKGPAAIADLPELLAHAHAIEQEAFERYADLADQMETHNNTELAELFARLVRIERIHADQILERAQGMVLPRIPPWKYRWPEFDGGGGGESPESLDMSGVHYLMTPHHALSMALAAEERALGFYRSVADAAGEPDVAALAGELAEEEREHVRLMAEWLAKYPAPKDGWADDPDPPAMQE
jgi:rubrerythrin